MRARSGNLLTIDLYRSIAAIALVLLTGFGNPAGAGTGSRYQVAAESALLRDFPSPESGILATLEHFDQVEYLDRNARGRWKVQSERTGKTGWSTEDLLAAARPAAPAAPGRTKYSYVNRPSLELRAIPLQSSASTGTVQLNDTMEILSKSSNGWTKVRALRNGNKGWLPTRFISAQIVTAPSPAAARKHVKRAGSVKKKKKMDPPKEEGEEEGKPM